MKKRDTVRTVDSIVSSIPTLLAPIPEIASAYLFGSFARGEAGPISDVDLALLMQESSGEVSGRWIGDLINRLEVVTAPHPVDLLLLERQGPIFCQRILKEGRLIFEADRQRRIDFESDVIVRAMDFRPTWEIAARGRIDGMLRWLDNRQ